MTTNEILKMIISFGNAALARRGIPVVMQQKNQPWQEGVPSGAAALVEQLFTMPYGTPGIKNIYDTDAFLENETQLTESHFQVSVLMKDSGNPASLTAKDVLEYLGRSFQSRAFIRTVQANGAGLLRVTSMRLFPFEDDERQNLLHPSFDIVIQHSNSYESTIPAATKITGTVHRV